MMLDHALDYAAAGWRVLPLRETLERGKAPYVAGGVHAATTDVDIVRDWWRRWPNALIGVRPPVGIVVVDIDPRNDGSLEALESVNGSALPETFSVRTGSGGWHLYYRFPADAGKPCKGIKDHNGAWLCGVDILTGHSSYVVAPPSIHPESLQPYTVAKRLPVAALPESLQEAIYAPQGSSKRLTSFQRSCPSKGQTKGAKGLIKVMARVPKKRRNNWLYWTARTLLDEGHPANVIDDLARAAITSGLGESEVWRTIASAQKAERCAA